VNAKRIHRLYREEGLSIRPRTPRRRRSCRYRAERAAVGAPNECWAMDFLSDQLFDGRPFRILAAIDVHTRESLALVPRVGFRAFQVVEVLDRLAAERGRPRVIKVDNGPEFAGKMLDQWAYLNGVELDFSRPGKPTDNAHVEAFNARFRQDRERRSRSERFLVPVPGRREGPDRAMEEGLQRGETTHRSRELDPEGLRHPSSPSPESCLAAGPNSGAGPDRR
jgi:putative transposase